MHQEEITKVRCESKNRSETAQSCYSLHLLFKGCIKKATYEPREKSNSLGVLQERKIHAVGKQWGGIKTVIEKRRMLST